MKRTKKLFVGLLLCLTTLTTAIAFTACEENDEFNTKPPQTSNSSQISGGSKKPPEINSSSENASDGADTLKETLSYKELDGLTANLDGVGALGINRVLISKATAPAQPVYKNRIVCATQDTAQKEDGTELTFTMTKTENNVIKGLTVTQDKISGEIDKLYVCGEYTFLQFADTSYNDLSMYIDGEIPKYYTRDYYSGDSCQSYVMDNETGKLYAFNEHIGEFTNCFMGVADENGGSLCNMSIKDGEVQFDKICKNPALTVYEVFRDKYGHTYIRNDYLNAYDEENKTVYYTKTCNYILSQEGVAIRLEYTGVFAFSYEKLPEAYSQIVKIEEDFSASEITAEETFRFDFNPLNSNNTYEKSDVTISKIENGYMYLYSVQGFAYTYYQRVDLSTLSVSGIRYGDYANYWEYECLKSAPIDDSTVLIWSDYTGTAKLYYAKVWGENAFTSMWKTEGNGMVVTEEKLTTLLENVVCDPDWSLDFHELQFRHDSIEKTVFYKLITDENGVPTVVDVATYEPPASVIKYFQAL